MRLILKPGREASILAGHQWLFSGAVAREEGEKTAPGDTVEIANHRGETVALAAYSPASQITGRIWTTDTGRKIDREFFRHRLTEALKLRQAINLTQADGGCRLVFSEGDYLPGLIVDRYKDVLVLQISSAGMDFHRELIVELLAELTNCRSIYERSDLNVRKHEGLPERNGLLCGEKITAPVIIQENGSLFSVNLTEGQKTGFYFDLRDVRQKISTLVKGKHVLNAFSYTGGFAVAALRNGAASVLNLDSSLPALQDAEVNIELNGLSKENCRFCKCDVFTELRNLKAGNKKFDFIILDPPKLISSRSALPKGCRGYQDLARLGFELLNPGGMLLNMSCSGLMTPELFQKITHDAAREAGRNARLIDTVRQAADHPVALTTPESFYLKGLISAVI